MIYLYLFAGLWIQFAAFESMEACKAKGNQILRDGDVVEYVCLEVE